jgi:hypothetical protein
VNGSCEGCETKRTRRTRWEATAGGGINPSWAGSDKSPEEGRGGGPFRPFARLCQRERANKTPRSAAVWPQRRSARVHSDPTTPAYA